MRILILVATLVCAGCTISPDPTPINTTTLAGNYQRVAACAYDRLSAGKRHNWKFTNLQGADKVIVAFDPQENVVQTPSMVWWEATFMKASENTTRVEVRTKATLVSSDGYHSRFWPTVQACAS